MPPKKDSVKAILRRRVSKVSTHPGVYRWLDSKGDMIYVGKAKNLRKRMQTYVQAKAKNSAWTEIMVRQIADFEVTVVKSELEALMLESNLIKELKPKYNIMLKDDKGYVYVRVSMFEPYPRVDIVRRIENDKARYFGPYTSGSQATERTVEMLDSILHFRACRGSLDSLNSNKPITGAACLDHQIGRCVGLCIGSVVKEDYNERIKKVISFFRGNLAEIKREAIAAMKAAAEEKKFEKAARFRDALGFIEDLEKRQAISDTSGEDIDVFGLAERSGKWQVVVLRQRDGKLVQELTFALKGEAESQADAMAQFLPQFYRETADIPSTVIVREALTEKSVLEEWLQGLRGTQVKIFTPERGRKSALLEMAEKNAEDKVEQQFAAWEAEVLKVDSALSGLQKIVGLSQKPRRIEGYDISHLGGTATVGSMVVFENGKPKREHYRSFNITSVKHGDIDDYKALSEVLRRRLKYLTDDLETLKGTWKEQGIILGKARKADVQTIEEICDRSPQDFLMRDFDYKTFMVLRKHDHIIGFARILDHSGCFEIKTVWVDPSERGQKLGYVLIRTLLARVKKGKVYVTLPADLEEYYAELGFRHIIELTPKFEAIIKEREKLIGSLPSIVMMWEAKQNKVDESFSSHPDLLLIDGGKGQLSSIVAVLKEMQIEIPAAGLAKREEEIFLPGASVSVSVPKDSEARFLLQRIRDEAHRFANLKREKRLDAVMTASALDDMAGIGEKTKTALLKTFGSLDAAKKATDEKLLEVLTEKKLLEFRAA